MNVFCRKLIASIVFLAFVFGASTSYAACGGHTVSVTWPSNVSINKVRYTDHDTNSPASDPPASSPSSNYCVRNNTLFYIEVNGWSIIPNLVIIRDTTFYCYSSTFGCSNT